MCGGSTAGTALDCKSSDHWSSWVRVPPPAPLLLPLTVVRKYAEIAQVVERIHGKNKVPGSNPGLGSLSLLLYLQ